MIQFRSTYSRVLATLLAFLQLGFTVGDVVELDQTLNGRSSARFEKDDTNIEVVLPQGTRGRVSQRKKFYSGNSAYEIQLLNGLGQGKKVWVYYANSRPGLSLICSKDDKFNEKTEICSGKSVARASHIVTRRAVAAIPSDPDDPWHSVLTANWAAKTLGKTAENPLRGCDVLDEPMDNDYPTVDHEMYGSESGIVLADWTVPLPKMKITSKFGKRRGRPHEGVDLRAKVGTPVQAPADGVVVFAGWKGGYGRLVEILHNNGYRTLYGHLSKIDVRRGTKVEQGEVIAKTGNSGRSNGPHLHFEILKGENKKPVNPLNALRELGAPLKTASLSLKPRQLDRIMRAKDFDFTAMLRSQRS